MAASKQSGEITAVMPYKTKFVSVNGSKMAYVEGGEGDPILFLHGNPTSKYLWRNIMPYLEKQGRIIAPDLIGMGESDKPKIPYRYHDHFDYLTSFIDALGLQNITLVLHDWGSGLGFNYAYQNQSRIKAIAFMEALVKPGSYSDLPAQFRLGFRMMRTPIIGWLMVSVGNMFIKQMLPQSIVRSLTEEEQSVYARPFPTVATRKPVLQWPREVPLDGKPSDVHKIVSDYSQWLQQTEIPKLFFYASPGAIIDGEDVEWVKQAFKNITAYDIGEGIHFVQEDNPHFIGEKLSEWYSQQNS